MFFFLHTQIFLFVLFFHFQNTIHIKAGFLGPKLNQHFFSITKQIPHKHRGFSNLNEKEEKIVDTKNVFTHQDPDMIYLLICMAMILGFVFFLTSEVTIFLRLFKQTMHQKVFFGIIIYHYTLFINKSHIKVIQ